MEISNEVGKGMLTHTQMRQLTGFALTIIVLPTIMFLRDFFFLGTHERAGGDEAMNHYKFQRDRSNLHYFNSIVRPLISLLLLLSGSEISTVLSAVNFYDYFVHISSENSYLSRLLMNIYFNFPLFHFRIRGGCYYRVKESLLDFHPLRHDCDPQGAHMIQISKVGKYLHLSICAGEKPENSVVRGTYNFLKICNCDNHPHKVTLVQQPVYTEDNLTWAEFQYAKNFVWNRDLESLHGIENYKIVVTAIIFLSGLTFTKEVMKRLYDRQGYVKKYDQFEAIVEKLCSRSGMYNTHKPKGIGLKTFVRLKNYIGAAQKFSTKSKLRSEESKMVRIYPFLKELRVAKVSVYITKVVDKAVHVIDETCKEVQCVERSLKHVVCSSPAPMVENMMSCLGKSISTHKKNILLNSLQINRCRKAVNRMVRTKKAVRIYKNVPEKQNLLTVKTILISSFKTNSICMVESSRLTKRSVFEYYLSRVENKEGLKKILEEQQAVALKELKNRYKTVMFQLVRQFGQRKDENKLRMPDSLRSSIAWHVKEENVDVVFEAYVKCKTPKEMRARLAEEGKDFSLSKLKKAADVFNKNKDALKDS